jgi:nicotinamidase-related amidase
MEQDINKIYQYYKPIESVDFIPSETALLIVDMQYGDASREHGIFAKARAQGDEYLFAYYFQRLEEEVIPNILKLQQAFRKVQSEVIFTRIESLKLNGRDRSASHKLLNFHIMPGSREGQILDEIRPENDEIVIAKTASGVFGTTNLDYILRNLGIRNLVVVGVFTNECVENAVRAAADLGYAVTVPEDAVAALTPKLQETSLFSLGHCYAQIMNTTDMISMMTKC